MVTKDLEAGRDTDGFDEDSFGLYAHTDNATPALSV